MADWRAPLGGTVRDLGAPTIYVKDDNGGPLGGTVGDLGTPTMYVGDVDGGPPRRRCQRPGSAHHLCQRCRWWTPWEALSEIQEHPQPMLETSIVGPLGGADRDPRALTTYVEDVDTGPVGGAIGDLGGPTTYVGDIDGRPLGGAVKDPGTLTTYVRDVDGRPPRRHCRRPKGAHHLCRRRRWWGP
jgi:hypothetical protein